MTFLGGQGVDTLRIFYINLRLKQISGYIKHAYDIYSKSPRSQQLATVGLLAMAGRRIPRAAPFSFYVGAILIAIFMMINIRE
jgi:hypothetical protein